MWIDKVMGDRWQKWWSRMCHMVFDAMLLVDTQEYRVLNAWGEEKVFGYKLQSHHPLLQLIKSEDLVSLKEAFNAVTFKGFERGRTLHLLKPSRSGNPAPAKLVLPPKEMPAQCFFLSSDQEDPNECMMGIRMRVSKFSEGHDSALWEVADSNQVMTLDDLASLKSGLKRHRRPARNPRSSKPRPRSSGPINSAQSLCSIPESEGEDLEDDTSEASIKSDTESLLSQESSKSSVGSESGSESGEALSQVGLCCSSPSRSVTDGVEQEKWRRAPHPPYNGPLVVKLRSAQGNLELNLDEFGSSSQLRLHIEATTGIPASRQTLIVAGKRLPPESEENATSWDELKLTIRPGQTLMLVGSVAMPCSPAKAAKVADVKDPETPQEAPEDKKQEAMEPPPGDIEQEVLAPSETEEQEQ
jgi:hypothetical protein